MHTETLKLNHIHKGRVIEFEVVYRKRKTMSIEVNLEGKVRICAPIKLELKNILDVVEKKANWICKKQDELIERGSIRRVNKYINGETYLYLGNEYILNIECNEDIKKPKVVIKDNIIQISYKQIDSATVKSILELWYRQKTLEVVIERVSNYTKFFAVSPKELKVKQQKRRWASCTYDNRILFNWRISMAPIDVIDYIVVHEMCHMDFKDHSNNFWNRVKSVMPDYELYKLWLKDNGLKLEI
ncbi:M48 family metallopeptidase [Clostridium gasigenes]|uniref:M48 family metallopeptidase n=1 Tax=Clostridium gasigenes TaxID=94869 RepID=UPI001C0D9EFC|nr:SprT family zinc-dependent metalloprotease [Clostridium gasigenes]MBU3087433.1 M48 family metallopeptidase [Clostridium gasigenes]